MNAVSKTNSNWTRRKVVVTLMVAACIPVFTVHVKAEAADSFNEDRGKKVYEFYCYQCHAYSGHANTVAATYLDPRPRNFTRSDPRKLTREMMLSAVRDGRAGTAMTSFSRVLSDEDMAAVVDYIRTTLMQTNRPDLAYHTPENGWKDHQRYEVAFDFALGTLPLDTPWKDLTASQRVGKKLFLSACVSCHEASTIGNNFLRWEPRAVSYPRSTDTCVDCHAGRPDELLPLSMAQKHPLIEKAPSRLLPGDFEASPYLNHAQPAHRQPQSESELRGKALFLENCAFCHAADGSGRNWIGSFLEPRPRDLRSDYFLEIKSTSHLIETIFNGIPNTSMPGWKGILSEKEIHDLVEYLSHGSGSTENPNKKAPAHPKQTGESSPGWTKRKTNNNN